jgi:hypothetical protein
VTVRYLEGQPVVILRRMANGMPHRHEATKQELVDWLRKYRPEVEGKACDDFYASAAYADVCGGCGLHITQHEQAPHA